MIVHKCPAMLSMLMKNTRLFASTFVVAGIIAIVQMLIPKATMAASPAVVCVTGSDGTKPSSYISVSQDSISVGLQTDATPIHSWTKVTPSDIVVQSVTSSDGNQFIIGYQSATNVIATFDNENAAYYCANRIRRRLIFLDSMKKPVVGSAAQGAVHLQTGTSTDHTGTLPDHVVGTANGGRGVQATSKPAVGQAPAAAPVPPTPSAGPSLAETSAWIVSNYESFATLTLGEDTYKGNVSISDCMFTGTFDRTLHSGPYEETLHGVAEIPLNLIDPSSVKAEANNDTSAVSLRAKFDAGKPIHITTHSSGLNDNGQTQPPSSASRILR
jgi:hypothetical protein